MKILTIIPARSGSKGIPHKNIKTFRNKPLLMWSILQAKQSKYLNNMKIVVSTDSLDYAHYIHDSSVQIIHRPSEIAQDNSTDIEFIQHAIEYLRHTENYTPDIILQLRPTQPCRKVKDIDLCIELFCNQRDNYDSLRTVVKINKTPYKMYKIENNNLIPYLKNYDAVIEPYNICRQDLPDSYLHNGYIDIINYSLLEKGMISGDNILPYVMESTDTLDIDTMEDWHRAEKMFIE
jgi:N-acylneuraminate cytidylyltransferase